MNDYPENTGRLLLTVRGTVQGVGFRPCVHGLATDMGLSGFVVNTAEGVVIEVEGPGATDFPRRLRQALPPLASITDMTVEHAEPLGGEGFEICPSVEGHGFTLVSADTSTCPDCLRELANPGDRRYRYPFINCTNCGPRYSITQSIPYDRPNTTMSAFEMCPACRAEYEDPTDRRFHAVPNACPECGPSLWLVVDGKPVEVQDPVAAAVKLMKDGKIVAIKGLGGFHLACDALNAEAVRLLRERKQRVRKPFALMAADIDTVRSYCHVSLAEETLLMSRQRPVVLLNGGHGPLSSGGHRGHGPLSSGGHGGHGPLSSGGQGGQIYAQGGLGPDQGGLGPDQGGLGPYQGGLVPLPEGIAPGNRDIGFMLPYTPLHYLIMREMRVAVMTSGNMSEEPIQCRNDEVLVSLSTLADAFLLHDRDIFMRVDDSVLRVAGARPLFTGSQPTHELGAQAPHEQEAGAPDNGSGMLSKGAGPHSEGLGPYSEGLGPHGPLFIRRSRGYAPESVRLNSGGPDLLAVGADMKNTFTLLRDDRAVMSQHMGDMDKYETVVFFEETLSNLKALYRVRPVALAHDMHPGYGSTRWALAQGLPKLAVQHHHAHIVSVMAEHGLDGPVIGVALDGTGYGPDGTLWGGEFLFADPGGFARLGQFGHIRLPGGERAIREPWRIAVSVLNDVFGREAMAIMDKLGFVFRHGEGVLNDVIKVADMDDFSPLSSGVGRYFDAASSLLGLCSDSSFEGEAAMALEGAASLAPAAEGGYEFGISKDQCPAIDFSEVFRRMALDRAGGRAVPEIAMAFHNTVARAVAEAASGISRVVGVRDVALSGGVFQNVTLLALVSRALEDAGLSVYANSVVPSNDGGVSLGQAVILRRQIDKAV